MGIFTMFVVGMACFSMGVICSYNNNWMAVLAWCIAGLLAWVISVMRIIAKKKDGGNEYYSEK